MKAQCSGRNSTGVEVWMARGTASNPVQRDAVTATLADTVLSVIIAVSRYSGVQATYPLGNVISGNTNGSNGACTGGVDSSSYSLSLTSTVNGALVYGVATMRTKTHKPGTGYTERVELQQGGIGNAVSLAVQDKSIASAATVLVDGSFNGAVDWAVAALVVRPKPYTLTVSTSGSGSVSLNPPGGVYNAGTVVTLTATSRSQDYVFSGYSGDFKGWMNVETITMDANKNLTTTFSPLPKPAPWAPQGIWTSAAEVKQLPTSGLGWDNLKAGADRPISPPNLSDFTDSVNVVVLAKALVYGRTGNEAYRQSVISACMAAIGTERSGETLALGRKLLAYVLAADLVGLPPTEDATFRAWLRNVLTENLNGKTLRSTHETRSNNWGTHCGATRAAIARYLGDATEIERTARVFKGWLGDRNTYADFSFSSDSIGLSWQANPNAPVGINPFRSTIQGHSVDDVLPDDQRRAGGFIWPPPKENYVYGALQGALMQATILYRAGYDVWNWQDHALYRALEWLYTVAHYPAVDDDQSLPYIVNHYYKTGFRAPFPAYPGKNTGWTDWLYGSKYVLTVSANNGRVDIHSLGAVHDSLSVMKVKAIPDNGYVFTGWSGDLRGARNPDTLIMNADKNVTAIFAASSSGQIVYEETQTGGASNSIQVTTSANLAALSNRLYLAAIATKPKVSVTAVSGLGLGWTRVRAQCSGRDQTGVEVWIAKGTPSANGTVSASLSSATVNAAIAVSQYAGADMANSIGAIISGNTNGVSGACASGVDNGAYSFNVTTTLNGAMIYCAAAMQNVTHTPGAGYTERAELLQGSAGSPMASIAVEDRPAHGTTVAVNGSFSNSVDWTAVGVEIRPQITTRVNDDMTAALPSTFQLEQNYPNPFNPGTTIRFSLPQSEHVILKIFDINGEEMQALVNGKLSAGEHSVKFDAVGLPSGIYFYRLVTPTGSLTKSMGILK